MKYTFYEMAVEIVGELPITGSWIYTITALILFICVIFILLTPVIVIHKRIGV